MRLRDNIIILANKKTKLFSHQNLQNLFLNKKTVMNFLSKAITHFLCVITSLCPSYHHHCQSGVYTHSASALRYASQETKKRAKAPFGSIVNLQLCQNLCVGKFGYMPEQICSSTAGCCWWSLISSATHKSCPIKKNTPNPTRLKEIKVFIVLLWMANWA